MEERLARWSLTNNRKKKRMAELAGDSLPTAMKRILELLENGEYDAKVYIFRPGDETPIELVAEASLRNVGINFPDIDNERDIIEKGAKKVTKKVDKTTEGIEECFDLPLMSSGQGSEGAKSLATAKSLWHSTKALRDVVTAINFGPGAPIDLLVEVIHATCFDMHRIMHEAYLVSKFMDMNSENAKLTKAFVVDVVKKRGTEGEKLGTIQQELIRLQQDVHMKNQSQLMKRCLSGGRAYHGQEAQENRGSRGRGRGRRGRGEFTPSTTSNPQPNATGGEQI